MRLLKTDRGVILSVYVKPHSRDFRIEVEDDGLVVYCREAPKKGKVNRELLEELSRLFKRRTAIIDGFTSKQKKILIIDVDLEEAEDAISKCKRHNSVTRVH